MNNPNLQNVQFSQPQLRKIGTGDEKTEISEFQRENSQNLILEGPLNPINAGQNQIVYSPKPQLNDGYEDDLEKDKREESLDQDEYDRNEEMMLLQEAMNVDGLIETQRSLEDQNERWEKFIDLKIFLISFFLKFIFIIIRFK